ncbi:MAG: hypothetical protein V3S69_00475 [Dehalococcoidales bacterium]
MEIISLLFFTGVISLFIVLGSKRAPVKHDNNEYQMEMEHYDSLGGECRVYRYGVDGALLYTAPCPMECDECVEA